MKILSLIIYFGLLSAFVVFGVIFAKDNTFLVSINFFGTELAAYPYWITIFVAFFSGAILMFFIMIWEFIKYYFKNTKKNEKTDEV